jgi:hypothetical protein
MIFLVKPNLFSLYLYPWAKAMAIQQGLKNSFRQFFLKMFSSIASGFGWRIKNKLSHFSALAKIFG